MMFLVLMGTALASGGGIYLEAAGGASTTDSTGFIARGSAFEFGFGGYGGNYRSTFRYGKYWRVGGVIKAHAVEPLGQLVQFSSSFGLRIGRGVDLMNLGAWWSVTAGYTATFSADTLADALDLYNLEDPVHGGFIRAALGLTYNFTHAFSMNIRYEPGLHFDGNGMSYLGGWGLGVQVRIPVIRTHWREEE
ncbi:MAG: hypothetical protein JRI25_27365 [Deltaproteobacteria bacterium]|nr:hypothetical protein [Deltaproteobacteria bacterium]